MCDELVSALRKISAPSGLGVCQRAESRQCSGYMGMGCCCQKYTFFSGRALGSSAPNHKPLGSDQFCHLWSGKVRLGAATKRGFKNIQPGPVGTPESPQVRAAAANITALEGPGGRGRGEHRVCADTRGPLLVRAKLLKSDVTGWWRRPPEQKLLLPSKWKRRVHFTWKREGNEAIWKFSHFGFPRRGRAIRFTLCRV